MTFIPVLLVRLCICKLKIHIETQWHHTIQIYMRTIHICIQF